MVKAFVFFYRHGESGGQQLRQAALGDSVSTEELQQHDHLFSLTDKGIKEVLRAAKFTAQFVKHNNLSSAISYLYSSPFTRARQTAELLSLGFREWGEESRVFHFKPDSYGHIIRIKDELREMNFGKWQNIPKERWQEIDPEAWEAFQKAYKNGTAYFYRMPGEGGESSAEMCARAKTFDKSLYDKIRKYEGLEQTVCFFVSGHSIAGNALFKDMMGHDGVVYINEARTLGNASLHLLSIEQTDKGLRRANHGCIFDIGKGIAQLEMPKPILPILKPFSSGVLDRVEELRNRGELDSLGLSKGPN